jgi:hypothetical protein
MLLSLYIFGLLLAPFPIPFPLVILGYPWLSLVILGYPWLSLVILGYPWLPHDYIIWPCDCRRFLQIMGKIIANEQTISHIGIIITRGITNWITNDN